MAALSTPTTFTFASSITPGWTTPSVAGTYAFTRRVGSTYGCSGSGNQQFGPASGPDDGGYYINIHKDNNWPGDVYTLSYDGSACTAPHGFIGSLDFQYHMTGSTLKVMSAEGEVLWSKSGFRSVTSWQQASVRVGGGHSVLRRCMAARGATARRLATWT